MTEEQTKVEDALRALCYRAGVHVSDKSESGARKVCAVFASEGFTVSHTDLCDPLDCPVNQWLRKETGLANVLTANDCVLLLYVDNDKRKYAVKVPLPAVVAEAVRLISSNRYSGLIHKPIAEAV